MADNNLLEELIKLNERFTQQEERLKELEKEIQELQLPWGLRKVNLKPQLILERIGLVVFSILLGLPGVFLIIAWLRNGVMFRLVAGVFLISVVFLMFFLNRRYGIKKQREQIEREREGR